MEKEAIAMPASHSAKEIKEAGGRIKAIAELKRLEKMSTVVTLIHICSEREFF